MIMKKNNKLSFKVKTRLFLAFIFFGTIISILSYNFINNLQRIKEMNETKKYLTEKIKDLKDEEEVLNADIQKLEDPTYVARYAREKYLYSKDGELIIRMDDVGE